MLIFAFFLWNWWKIQSFQQWSIGTWVGCVGCIRCDRWIGPHGAVFRETDLHNDRRDCRAAIGFNDDRYIRRVKGLTGDNETGRRDGPRLSVGGGKRQIQTRFTAAVRHRSGTSRMLRQVNDEIAPLVGGRMWSTVLRNSACPLTKIKR